MTLHQIFNKILFFSMGLIVYSIVIVACLFCLIFRFFVRLLLDKKKHRLIESGTATNMAEEMKEPQNVLYVLKCTGTPNVDKIVDKLDKMVTFETKLACGGEVETPYRPFSKLGHIIVKMYGVFCWNIDHSFRAENHVVMDKVQRNLDMEIQARCETLLDTFHGNHQPQWQMQILYRDESNEYAVVWSVHHSYGDATIFTQVIRHALADDPFTMKIEPLEWNRKEKSLFCKIVFETLFLCTVGCGWFAAIYAQCLGQTRVRENALSEKRGRSHCRTVTLDLVELKATKRKLSEETPIRLVSLLYAFVAPAFERAISSSKSEKLSTILAGTIEANYPYNNLEVCVNVHIVQFDLPLNIKLLQERLRVIDTRIRSATGHLRMNIIKLATTMVGTFISPLARLCQASGLITQTTFISNIVGPQNYFTIFGGDRVTSMYVYGAIALEEVVTIEAYTYGGQITLAMMTPDRVISKLPRFLDDLVAGINDEMGKYIQFSNQSEQNTHNREIL